MDVPGEWHVFLLRVSVVQSFVYARPYFTPLTNFFLEKESQPEEILSS